MWARYFLVAAWYENVRNYVTFIYGGRCCDNLSLSSLPVTCALRTPGQVCLKPTTSFQILLAEQLTWQEPRMLYLAPLSRRPIPNPVVDLP